ncbi:MarR family transcriptional regulator [Aneurinibacillus sp. Ricciae_BoGa-3]|uniref:MarR family winged helix-turn-helix transcriptional regulator n=1 Tax=Aneurinibacillus sp. Ricciae_BoGa-3 TaxID=3022697 RepID=UPI0023416E80|nr:MarR family transcriptional regulator [Aneurinibacillus sp. Ricciae_BoGa-3]WCK56309.1 MarR family transcriptional regulator [Aneurinibacillus sp. Ricciae_BoGa-3]
MQGFFQRYLVLYRPLITRLNELLGTYDLSYSLWQVIFYVKNNGPSTLVDISSNFNVEKPTITRTVHRLEETGLVNRIPGKDRREKIIQLTELGEEVYQACRKKITELEYRVMEGIPAEEQNAAFRILPKMRENVTNKEGNNNE